MTATNNALSERNERVKLAKSLGVVKPHTLKKDALEAAIVAARLANRQAEVVAARELMMAKKLDHLMMTDDEVIAAAAKLSDDDPFDEIDPEVEGDHLTEDVLPEAETVAEALSMRDATREAWLMAAVEALRPVLAQHGASNILNRKIAVSVGFPKGNVRKVIGQCWAQTSSGNGEINHAFISPVLEDSIQVLGVLLHEMIHADDNGESSHKGHFAQVARAAGLTGKMTATEVGPELEIILKSIADELGPYPHVKLNITSPIIKKQSTRMLKVTCTGRVWDDNEGDYVERGCEVADDNGNGYTIRLTKKWAELGLPTCPCGGEMTLEDAPEGD